MNAGLRAALGALALLACSPARAGPDELPGVVSINLCADQLLLELAAPRQIRSLSKLVADPAASHHVERARGVPTNDGSAEPVLAAGADVVIVGEYSDPYTVRLLEVRGQAVRTLPLADSVRGVLDNLQLVGDWIGRAEAARALVASLEARLDAVASSIPERRDALAAAVYDPNGYTAGPESLRGEMLARAGFANVAEAAGITGYGSLSLESVLRHEPDVLIDSPFSPGTWSRAQALSLHPALRSRGLDPDVITLPSADTICGGPWTVALIERLAAERHDIESRLPPD